MTTRLGGLLRQAPNDGLHTCNECLDASHEHCALSLCACSICHPARHVEAWQRSRNARTQLTEPKVRQVQEPPLSTHRKRVDRRNSTDMNGVAKAPPTAEQAEAIRSMWEAGHPVSHIAQDVRTSRYHVRKVLTGCGKTPPSR